MKGKHVISIIFVFGFKFLTNETVDRRRQAERSSRCIIIIGEDLGEGSDRENCCLTGRSTGCMLIIVEVVGKQIDGENCCLTIQRVSYPHYKRGFGEQTEGENSCLTLPVHDEWTNFE